MLNGLIRVVVRIHLNGLIMHCTLLYHRRSAAKNHQNRD